MPASKVTRAICCMVALYTFKRILRVAYGVKKPYGACKQNHRHFIRMHLSSNIYRNTDIGSAKRPLVWNIPALPVSKKKNLNVYLNVTQWRTPQYHYSGCHASCLQCKQIACYAINRLTTDVCTTVTTGNIAEPL